MLFARKFNCDTDGKVIEDAEKMVKDFTRLALFHLQIVPFGSKALAD